MENGCVKNENVFSGVCKERRCFLAYNDTNVYESIKIIDFDSK